MSGDQADPGSPGPREGWWGWMERVEVFTPEPLDLPQAMVFLEEKPWISMDSGSIILIDQSQLG